MNAARNRDDRFTVQVRRDRQGDTGWVDTNPLDWPNGDTTSFMAAEQFAITLLDNDPFAEVRVIRHNPNHGKDVLSYRTNLD